MNGFDRYMHIERFGQDEVAGIELGDCWVFPKLDGANASIWKHDGAVNCGSRNRCLTGGGNVEDNHGFRAWTCAQQPLFDLLGQHPGLHLHGEWLVPHTLKTYRASAIRRFWIFDVFDRDQDRWLTYEEYSAILSQHPVDYVPPLAKITNPSEADLRRWVDQNTYLIEDGAGVGEGIVIKRYDFVNQYGKTVWAKLVRNEFKEENRQAFGVAEQAGTFQPELDIVDRQLTAALVAKERAKLEAMGLNRTQLIPRLLETVFHCLVVEELWAALKRLKNPIIDFRKLRQLSYQQTKKMAQDLF